MESFQSETEAFNLCLAEWVDDTAQQAEKERAIAVDLLQRAIDYWNCKAEPGNVCFGP